MAAVFSLNPYGMDVGTRALGTMDALGKIIGQSGLNKQQALLNTFNQQTLPGLAEWENVKNALNTQYFPQEKQIGLDQLYANLGLTGAQTRHANALTSQARTQTNLLGQKDNPFATFQNAVQQYKNSPEGSLAKQYYANVIRALMGSGGSPALTLGKSGGAAGAGASGGMSLIQPGTTVNGITLNPMGASGKSGFHQGIIDNADGGITTLESPTQMAAGQAQVRIAAEEELKQLRPQIEKGLSPYLGLGGNYRLSSDMITYQTTKDKKKKAEVEQRLKDYALANKYLEEYATINAKQASGGQPGIEATRGMKESLFGDRPMDWLAKIMPQNIGEHALKGFGNLQSKAIGASINAERTGFPFQSDVPAWAQQTQVQNQYFPDVGNFPIAVNKPMQAPQVNLDAMAQQAIAQGADPAAVNQLLQQLKAQQ